MADPFIGRWKMIPEKNDYESGLPPLDGLYIIKADGKGYEIIMEWTQPDGDHMSMSYKAVPDNQIQPSDAPGVDNTKMTRVDEKTLDSEAIKDGVVIAYARRSLSKDNNTMTVTQTGTNSYGGQFTNTSVYVRLE